MTKRDYCQDESKADERFPGSPAQENKCSRHKFHKWNCAPDDPERPSWKESILVGQEEASNVFGRTELKNFENAGHEENQAEDGPREKKSPSERNECFSVHRAIVAGLLARLPFGSVRAG